MTMATDTDTNTRKLEEALRKRYPVEIHFIPAEEDSTEYYMAFHRDFGVSACSAVGETPEEALSSLNEVRAQVIRHYLATGKPLPEPSAAPVEPMPLQQMPLRVPKDL